MQKNSPHPRHCAMHLGGNSQLLAFSRGAEGLDLISKAQTFKISTEKQAPKAQGSES